MVGQECARAGQHDEVDDGADDDEEEDDFSGHGLVVGTDFRSQGSSHNKLGRESSS